MVQHIQGLKMHLLIGHIYNAIEGRMSRFERYFQTLEAAKEFSENESYDHVKIYDHNNELVHTQANTFEGKTYA